MPRASGDTPKISGINNRILEDAPRKWGYTLQSNAFATAAPGCPAQVGIHRTAPDLSGSIVRMPRASGDTPYQIFDRENGWTDAPRKWGYTLIYILCVESA